MQPVNGTSTFPPNFDQSKKEPAIVSVHPFGRLNDQSALIAGDRP
jgi:fermentation-respiration switch protein FrsA (DUF1100 family)